MTHRKKLIEVALPLEAINAASAREKSIRHGHPSTLHLWWARRPLAACRAVLFAQLVDDPSSSRGQRRLRASSCSDARRDALSARPPVWLRRSSSTARGCTSCTSWRPRSACGCGRRACGARARSDGLKTMAISNKDRISRTLDLLRDGLVPFVERELKAKLTRNVTKLEQIQKLRDGVVHANEYAATPEQARDVCAVVRDLLDLRAELAGTGRIL